MSGYFNVSLTQEDVGRGICAVNVFFNPNLRQCRSDDGSLYSSWLYYLRELIEEWGPCIATSSQMSRVWKCFGMLYFFLSQLESVEKVPVLIVYTKPRKCRNCLDPYSPHVFLFYSTSESVLTINVTVNPAT